jgi:hypothetical protein
MWPVNKRYLDNDDFVSKKQLSAEFQPSAADKYILNQRGHEQARVLNLAVNTFNDATTSYFHQSIGGYHGAKMRRYQELIEYHIQPEMQSFVTKIREGSDESPFAATTALNMLNTKYIIVQENREPLVNQHALGKAWFVNKAVVVDNADEEIAALNGIDPAETAIVHNRFTDQLTKNTFMVDSACGIRQQSYQPNYLVYRSSCRNDGLAVFSEIYYPKGWHAFIDGEPAPHFRANYVLRAMMIPKGEHTIEFKFKPASYYTGEKISFASSLLLILAVIGSIVYEIKRTRG